MVRVKIHWGSLPAQLEAPAQEYTFETAAELAAFLKGIEECSGWDGHEVCGEDQNLGCDVCAAKKEFKEGL